MSLTLGVAIPGVGSGVGTPPPVHSGCQEKSPIVVRFSVFCSILIVASCPLHTISESSKTFFEFLVILNVPTLSPPTVTVKVALPFELVKALNLSAVIPPGIVTLNEPLLPIVR